MQTAFSERLPCELMPSEVESKSAELAREVKRHGELELEKKTAVAEFSAQLKESDRRIGELAEEVRERREYREVMCAERVGFPANVVEIYRLDTGEVVRKRPLTEDERQTEMFAAGEFAAVAERGRKRRTTLASHGFGPAEVPPDNDNAGDDEDETAKH